MKKEDIEKLTFEMFFNARTKHLSILELYCVKKRKKAVKIDKDFKIPVNG